MAWRSWTERTTVLSPVDGYLGDQTMRVGDYVKTGTPVLSIVDTNSLRVEGYFEETKLHAIAIGQPVDIHVMGETQHLRGHVQSIAAGIEDRDRVAATRCCLISTRVSTGCAWRSGFRFGWCSTKASRATSASWSAARLPSRCCRGRPPTRAARHHEPIPYPALPLLVTLLAACSAVGPDYRVPDQAVVRQAAAQAPFDTLGNPEVEQTPLPDGWWQLYDDPLLDRLVREALAGNRDIRQAHHNSRQAYQGFQMAHHAQEVVVGGDGSLRAASCPARRWR